jgi:hypothetical protein
MRVSKAGGGGVWIGYTLDMEFLKIVGMCVLAGVLYGVLHDQVTARVCVEYFTVFHPPVFATQSPTLLGIGWGVIATWWVGAILGVVLGLASRMGGRAKMTVRQIAPLVGRLLFLMGLCALVCGTLGYFFGTVPEFVRGTLMAAKQRPFLFDWWAHCASYAVGILGGLVVAVLVWKRRQGGVSQAYLSG